MLSDMFSFAPTDFHHWRFARKSWRHQHDKCHRNNLLTFLTSADKETGKNSSAEYKNANPLRPPPLSFSRLSCEFNSSFASAGLQVSLQDTICSKLPSKACLDGLCHRLCPVTSCFARRNDVCHQSRKHQHEIGGSSAVTATLLCFVDRLKIDQLSMSSV